MARRIMLAVMALIVALLGVIAVPLGLITAGQDRRDFQGEALAAAATLANVAEERLSDRTNGPALARSIVGLARSGDQLSVYDKAGTRQGGTAAFPVLPSRVVRRVVADEEPVLYPAEDRLIVVAPVLRSNGHDAIGAVMLSRPSEELNHRLAVLWTWLAAVSVAGLLAAVLVSTALARWVGRPLAELEAAARELGGGGLETRAAMGDGPSEVRRLAANFNTMAARLQALVHGHQAMMADVSHQLRTPLAALRLRLDVLAQDVDGPVADELAGAQEEIARLTRMVNGLLAVARAENVTTSAVHVAVDAVVTDRVAAWRPAAEERGITLTTSVPEPVGTRLGEGHLEQIMDNLLANTLDAVPAGGTVRVATSAGPAARIVVADDGPGMSQQQQSTAFRRFASAKPGGTGLGLAIVDRLVTSNGGSAALSDTPGGGLTVTVDLPSAHSERGNRRTGPASS